MSCDEAPSAEDPSAEDDRTEDAGAGWAYLGLGLAGLEVLLAGAAWFVALSKNEGLCPGGEAFSCSGLFRERIGALGPLHLTQLAPLGAVLTLLALIGLRLYPPRAQALRRVAASVPALGAGVALAAQVLALRATGAFCLLCLGVAGAALGAALATLPSLPRPERRWLLGALGLSLCLMGGAAFARGGWLAADDAARRARLSALESGAAAGPTLVLVTREGCPFCAILELDRLADPSLEDVLRRVRKLERVSETDPRAQAHAGGPGAPVLLALDEAGQLRGRLRGAKPLSEVRAFLESVTR